MFGKVNSSYLLGIDSLKVDIEVDISNQGMPQFSIVGLVENSVKESRERVRSALKNLGYNLFGKPIVINLAPADFRKEGTHFDLGIAIGLLIAAGYIDNKEVEDTVILGELSLDGKLRSVAGVLPIVEYSKKNGFKNVILPSGNLKEALFIDNINIYHSDNLQDIIHHLKNEKLLIPHRSDMEIVDSYDIEYEHDFEDVKGQFAGCRAIEIAAAGRHNIIMIGSPGSGKTMMAKRVPSILPPLTFNESLETTKIHSIAGLLRRQNDLVCTRPFISPHHTASNVAIIGGGSKATPGQVSIANAGVLFLDEMLEFDKNVLEVLRQPLEDREVTIARAGRTVTYPANFMLIGAMNPCPCGYYGDSSKECICSRTVIDRYRAKLSGPLLDRIDMHIHISSVAHDDLISLNKGENSKTIRERVMKAHELQIARFVDSNINFNSDMGEKDIKKFCKLTTEAEDILYKALKSYNLSARAYSKVIKTARTIADISGDMDIGKTHILESLQYRFNDAN